MSTSYAATGALTPRMRDVLAMATHGFTVAETARELLLSEATVRGERAAACRRLGVSNVTAAVYQWAKL